MRYPVESFVREKNSVGGSNLHGYTGDRLVVSERRGGATPNAGVRRRTTARSGGPGGQNVNKVETKVTLHFTVRDSRVLSEAQKGDICARLAEAGDRRFDGWKIVITSQALRTLGDNKRAALEKLNLLLEELTLPKIERIPTDAPEFVAKNRLRDKEIRSRTKAQRRENYDRPE